MRQFLGTTFVFVGLVAVAGWALTGCKFDQSGITTGNNTSPAVCGDGVVEGSEACDDGNTADDDGCSGTCQQEAGWDRARPAHH